MPSSPFKPGDAKHRIRQHPLVRRKSFDSWIFLAIGPKAEAAERLVRLDDRDASLGRFARRSEDFAREIRHHRDAASPIA